MLKGLFRYLLFKEKSSSDRFIRYLKREGASIGSGVHFYDVRSCYFGLNYCFNLSIGDNVQITHGVVILDHGYEWSVVKGAYGDVQGNTGPVAIGSNVFIGANAVILKGVTIGDNVIIGAGSIVSKDIPSNSVAAGVPCRVISTLDNYRSHRSKKQVDEAFALFRSYYLSHSRVPPKEIFREYFWIFEKTSKDFIDEYKDIMQLLPDSREKTEAAFSSHVPSFDCYDSFIRYCVDRFQEEEGNYKDGTKN